MTPRYMKSHELRSTRFDCAGGELTPHRAGRFARMLRMANQLLSGAPVRPNVDAVDNFGCKRQPFGRSALGDTEPSDLLAELQSLKGLL